MENNQSVAKLIDSTTSKIQQLQKAFAELESHRAVTLNVKWKQLEEHFHGLEKSLKRRFTELEDQEKDFDMKITESKEMLERREAAVLCKERASLERLQLKRDAAVSAIAMAIISESNVEEQTNSENRFMEVKSYPELIQLCKQMDSENLHKFISDNRKNLAVIKEEIPFALKAASNPASLVLDSLKGFYSPEMSISDAKKDANLLGLRRTCIMLMECLSALLATLKNDSLKNIITEIVKKQAKDIAEGWKLMLEELDVDASNGNSLEAHAFLQLVATFGIDSHFDQHNLIKLIPMVCRRHQTAELCRFLGLSDKMPGVINVLVNNGRQIDAVNLAVSFGLTEQFSPVTLLKSYLSEATKVSSPVKDGNASSVQNDVIEKELSAIKTVIKCSEDNKLGAEYPLEQLQKRVLQLEKAKADKKRGTEVAKPQTKRPRANGGGYGPHKNNMYARTTTDQQRHPHYMYDNRSSPYCYPVQPPVAAPYHANFFANGFQYQAPYLH